MVGLHIHPGNGLAVLDIGRIPGRTSHDNHLQHFIHVGFQLRINPGLIHLREVAQVYTFRRVPVHFSHDILVNLLCHKRNHGSSRLCHGHKGRVQGHEGINLILLHSLCPEALTASAHIPVA